MSLINKPVELLGDIKDIEGDVLEAFISANDKVEHGDIVVTGETFVDIGTSAETFVSDDSNDVCASDNGTIIIVDDKTFCPGK